MKTVAMFTLFLITNAFGNCINLSGTYEVTKCDMEIQNSLFLATHKPLSYEGNAIREGAILEFTQKGCEEITTTLTTSYNSAKHTVKLEKKSSDTLYKYRANFTKNSLKLTTKRKKAYKDDNNFTPGLVFSEKTYDKITQKDNGDLELRKVHSMGALMLYFIPMPLRFNDSCQLSKTN